jgi:excisionase family DNA binding protein
MASTERLSPWGSRALTRDDILDAGQVADLLGVRRSTVEDWGRRGELPCVRLGKHPRFLRADVEAFVLGPRGRAA